MSIQVSRHGSLEYSFSDLISTPHAFTTRYGGVSLNHLASMNIGIHRGDLAENVSKNYSILASACGFDVNKLVLSSQTHSDIIYTVTASDWGSGLTRPELPTCDALITNESGTTLVVFTADCTPVILWDSQTGAVGAIHAGWRGTALDIVGKTVFAMQKEFGSIPENIHAAIGPNIASCCFETDFDVPSALLKTYGDDCIPLIRKQGSKYFPDLKSINALALSRIGVSSIDINLECTACLNKKYWSHRIVKGNRGSQGALITCK